MVGKSYRVVWQMVSVVPLFRVLLRNPEGRRSLLLMIVRARRGSMTQNECIVRLRFRLSVSTELRALNRIRLS